MSAWIEHEIEGRLGIVRLNRPQAINALSHDMIETLTRILLDWQDDARIGAVLFQGNGARGFCAGGDVRAVRALVMAGEQVRAEDYFIQEYRLNGLIASYRKPTIALVHGAVMGGGIGIAGHARYRFAQEETRFAMPEAAIGFVVDTGVTAILSKAPEPHALAFLLSGQAVDVADALALGLVDAFIGQDRQEGLVSGLIAAASSGAVDAAIVSLMAAESLEAGPAKLCALADELADCFAGARARDIFSCLKEKAHLSQEVEALVRTIGSRAPTSLEAMVLSYRRARVNDAMDAVLAVDLALARFMIAQPDFVEGVRAVLVDKDFSPAWHPAQFADVPYGALETALASIG